MEREDRNRESRKLTRIMSTDKIFFIIPFLLGLSYSVYSVTLRTKIGMLAGSNYPYMILITSMETIPGIFSVIMGYYIDKFGGGLSIIFGFLASISLLVFPLASLNILPILVFVFVSSYMLYTPIIYGIILKKAMGSGKKLGLLLMMQSIGWTLGGLFPATFSLFGAIDFGFVFSSLMLLFSTWLLSIIEKPVKSVVSTVNSLGDFARVISLNWKISLGIIMWSSAYSMMSGVFSLKLYNSVNSEFEYGIYFTVLTGIASIIVRPYAGIIVDKVDPIKIILASITAYLLLSLALVIATPALIVILWITPIYPFFDTASYSLLSKAMGEKFQFTAAGIISTSMSIGGTINFLLYNFLKTQEFESLLFIASAIFFISIIWYLFLFSKVLISFRCKER
ncbi:MAG: MFS transporter [Thermoprotei archaeon]|nr:MFS transporter [Thermoprotei archaeon]